MKIALIWVILSLILFAGGEAASKKFSDTGLYKWSFMALIGYILCEIPWFVAMRNYNNLTTLGTIWCIGAVVSTVIVGHIIFGEYVSNRQWFGILLALITCFLLAEQH